MNEFNLKPGFIYADLTYKINGALFNVFNNVGYGHKESFYQKATAHELTILQFNFKEQLPAKILYKSIKIGIYYFDFLIEDKIVLEIKVRNYFSKKRYRTIICLSKSKKFKTRNYSSFY